MPEFMGDDVRFGKFAGCSEAISQIVVEPEVDVDLLIVRTVERTDRRLPHPTSGRRRTTKQNELRVAIAGQNLAPRRILDVVDRPVHELREMFFRRALIGW